MDRRSAVDASPRPHGLHQLRCLGGRVDYHIPLRLRDGYGLSAVAMQRAADGLVRIRAAHGPKALAGFGSAKGSNEEAYLFQKLVRTGFGSNNVDHCTRLCHASSVAALMEGIGSGAVTAGSGPWYRRTSPSPAPTSRSSAPSPVQSQTAGRERA